VVIFEGPGGKKQGVKGGGRPSPSPGPKNSKQPGVLQRGAGWWMILGGGTDSLYELRPLTPLPNNLVGSNRADLFADPRGEILSRTTEQSSTPQQ